MRRFKPFGPFPIHRNSDLIDRKEGLKKFWEQVNDKEPGLSTARGCYIFVASTPSRPLKPWYVGQAKNKFDPEAFRNLDGYNSILNNTSKTPYMFLLADMTPQDQWKSTKDSNKKDPEIDYLETLLIGLALEKNPKLLNIQKARMLANLSIPGIVGASARTNSEKALKDMLF